MCTPRTAAISSARRPSSVSRIARARSASPRSSDFDRARNTACSAASAVSFDFPGICDLRNPHPRKIIHSIAHSQAVCLGLEQSLGTRLVTYADDLVILCRRGSAEKALHHLRAILGKLKLTVNEEKTRICRVPDGEFDFLGYTFGRMYSPVTGKARLGYRPSKKSLKRMVERVHALTVRAATW